jgi:hypothetical protein
MILGLWPIMIRMSNRRRASDFPIGTQSPPRHADSRHLALRAVLIILAGFLSACTSPKESIAEQQSGPAMYATRETNLPAYAKQGYWLGRNIEMAEKRFGRPTFSEQLIETGGMLVIYDSYRDPVRFVFETDPGGMIVKATRVD